MFKAVPISVNSHDETFSFDRERQRNGLRHHDHFRLRNAVEFCGVVPRQTFFQFDRQTFKLLL